MILVKVPEAGMKSRNALQLAEMVLEAGIRSKNALQWMEIVLVQELIEYANGHQCAYWSPCGLFKEAYGHQCSYFSGLDDFEVAGGRIRSSESAGG